MEKRPLRKTRVGVVVGNKAEKTISVAIERKVPHPIYKKLLTLWLMMKRMNAV